MLFLLSPAKSLDESTSPSIVINREPLLLDETKYLITKAKTLSSLDIQKLMKVSKKLGDLNYQRFQNFTIPFTEENAKPAIYLFKGDVYGELDAYHLTQTNIDFLDQNFVILSGLYGALRPLDLIQPYRLEMGIAFANQRGKNLYQFWNDRITDYLNQRIKDKSHSHIINLASNEYFKVIDPSKLNAPVIAPIFKDKHNGKYKIISFYAKKARGLMSKYIAENSVNNINQLKKFNYEGYSYVETQDETQLLFLRDIETANA